jgi:MFS family permease
MNSGGILGMVLSWGVSPLLIDKLGILSQRVPLNLLGWQSLFFISGGAGILWLGPWLFFTTETPEYPGKYPSRLTLYIRSVSGSKQRRVRMDSFKSPSCDTHNFDTLAGHLNFIASPDPDSESIFT